MRILTLAPHTDDGQFGAGAFQSACVEAGKTVFEMTFSFKDDEELFEEWKDSLDRLGVRKMDHPINIPRREFPAHRQEILDAMIDVRQHFEPDVVLCPATSDTHQDHEAVQQEAFRAFKDRTILGYYLPWNCKSMAPNYFFPVPFDDVQAKCEAIECYESQAGRFYSRIDRVVADLTHWGQMVGHEFAEAFEVIRWVAN